MGLLSGSASVARFTVLERPDEPDFDRLAFEPIPAGSERRESAGFLSMEPGAEYTLGVRRHAFRIRFDRVRPDPAAVAELRRERERAELDGSDRTALPSGRRRELTAEVEAELALRTPPRTTLVEGVLDGDTVYLGSSARARLGACLLLLRQLGIVTRLGAPWLDTPGAAAVEIPWLRLTEPGASPLGCRFLRALIEEGEMMAEPVDGGARLATPELDIRLAGAVHVELFRWLDAGAEVLAAKLVSEQGPFRFDAPSYRLVSLRLDVDSSGGWRDRLEARLEAIATLYEKLDEKYAALAAPAAAGEVAAGA